MAFPYTIINYLTPFLITIFVLPSNLLGLPPEESQHPCHILTEGVLQSVFDHIDAQELKYVEDLRQFVKIPSVSAFPSHYKYLIHATQWVRSKLKKLGFETDIRYIRRGLKKIPIIRRKGAVMNDSPLFLPRKGRNTTGPPFLFARLPKSQHDASLNNISLLIYGHVDVVPALKMDGWTHDPFTLTRNGSRLTGRGATDDKGPILSWINAIRALVDLNICIPFDIKFFTESAEESGSIGMKRILAQESSFFNNTDYAVISDNFCPNEPCLTYGLRGLVYVFVEIESAKDDLHSGVFGGTVQESLQELIYIMSRLVNVTTGHILIPGLYEDVAPLTEDELQSYRNFSFDLNTYRRVSGAIGSLLHPSILDTLIFKWREPSLSFHGIEGDFSGPGSKTVIPHRVTGKFSVRLVPHQKPSKVTAHIVKFIMGIHKRLGTGNRMKVKIREEIESWLTDPGNDNYRIARRALRRVYGRSPEMTRDGGSVPVAVYVSQYLRHPNASLILIPLSYSTDQPHSANEHIDVPAYLRGIKSLVSYIYELAAHNSLQPQSNDVH